MPEIQIPEKSGIDNAPVYDWRTDPETVMLGNLVRVCISLSSIHHCFPFADSQYTECMQGLGISNSPSLACTCQCARSANYIVTQSQFLIL